MRGGLRVKIYLGGWAVALMENQRGGRHPNKVKSQHSRDPSEGGGWEWGRVMLVQGQLCWLWYPHHRFVAGTTQTVQLIFLVGDSCFYASRYGCCCTRVVYWWLHNGRQGEVWPPGVLHSVPTRACPRGIEKESDRLEVMSQKVKRCSVWMLDLTSYT